MAKPLLSKDTILDGALDLLASEGADALSVRRLATHLKCSPNTLYQQVGPRDELIHQLLARQFSNAGCDFKAGETWQATAYAWSIALRHVLIANPVLTRLMTVGHRGLVLEDVNALLKSLLQQGLQKDLALPACRVLTHVVLGLCFTELQTPEDYQRQRRGRRNRMDLDDLMISNQQPSATIVPQIFNQAILWTIAGIASEERAI